MPPHAFGPEHLIYLGITVPLTIFLLVFAKLKLKTEEQQRKLFLISGLVGLVCIILNRVFICIFLENNNFFYLIPETLCGTTSMLLSISLVFLKRDNICLHMVWLISLLGMSIATFYPNYLGDGDTIFFPPTFTSLLHHSVSLFNVVAIFLLGYIRLSWKKAWAQLVYIAYFSLMGPFLMYVLKMRDAFSMHEPLLAGTPLIFWVLVPIYFVVYAIIIGGIELIRNKRQKAN